MSHSKEVLCSYANVWVRQKLFSEVGETIGGHKHHYDHLSILAKGKAKVELKKDNGEVVTKEFTAPTFIVIRKEHIHNVTALTDDVLWYCIFANRDIDGNVFCESNDVLGESANKMNLEHITIDE